MTNIAFIPARGNSKEIKRKNLVPLGGKPLLQWTVESAKKHFHEVYVSSEDDEILSLAVTLGACVLQREKKLSNDYVTATEVLLKEASNNIAFDEDNIFLLQPTSPFRSDQSISSAIALLERVDTVIGVTEAAKENTLRRIVNGFYLENPVDKYGLLKDKQRQNVEPIYKINGAIFGTKWNILKKEKTFNSALAASVKMDFFESIEIDSETDLTLARKLLITKDMDV